VTLGVLGLASRAAAQGLPGDVGTNNPRVIVAFGDSITSGTLGDPPRDIADRPYPAGLQLLLDGPRPGVLVLNRGRGGEQTDDGAERIRSVLQTDRPAVILLMQGTNDTFAVDPGSIVANLRQMIRLARANATVPILGAIPPNFRAEADEARAIIASVNARLPGLAAEEGIRFVDTFAALDHPALFGEDGFHPNQQGYDALAAAWLPAALDALEPSLLASFPGVNGPPGTASPDASIAAGPRTLVVARKSVVGIGDKGGRLVASKSIQAFFGPVLRPGEGFLTDPQATFDAASGRFFLIASARIDDPGCAPGTCVAHMLLAVSKRADPESLDAADWHLYALDRTREQTPAGTMVTTHWGDTDHLAVVGEVVVITSRTFEFSTGSPRGPKVRLLDKATLLDGEPVTVWTDLTGFGPDTFAGLLPATTFGRGGPVFLVSRAGCGFTVWGIETPLTVPILTGRTVGATEGACGGPPDAPQPGGPLLDVAGVGFNAQPVYRGGSLWIADTVGRNFGSGAVAAIRWLQLDVGGWPASVRIVQDAVLGADAIAHFAPALTVDPTGNVTMVYARSSPAEFASAYVTGRRATDPPNTLRPGQRLQAGVAPLALLELGRNRFTDSFSAALDPADGTAWLLGMYAQAADRIGTWVGRLGFSASPTLTLELDQDAFRAGDTLSLRATLTPGGLPAAVDAYIVVRLPDGSFSSLASDGTLLPGLWPIEHAFTPFPFSGEVFRFTFQGGESPGTYTWMGALTQPGTLTLIGSLDQDPFTVGP
jgi:lysophospholipase L1-like esterase